jgi:hypothetical protein
VSYAIREVVERANVPEGFVRQLIAAGALPAEVAGWVPGRCGELGVQAGPAKTTSSTVGWK